MNNGEIQSDIGHLVSEIAEILTENDQTVTTVESCTGGGIAHALTGIPGSSNWFKQGYVTYSNESKSELVGVPAELIDRFGAVSLEVAESMAEGARISANADYGLSVTGIAGPGGGSEEKPVGTVCFGWSHISGAVESQIQHFEGDRTTVRLLSIQFSLKEYLDSLNRN